MLRFYRIIAFINDPIAIVGLHLVSDNHIVAHAWSCIFKYATNGYDYEKWIYLCSIHDELKMRHLRCATLWLPEKNRENHQKD